MVYQSQQFLETNRLLLLDNAALKKDLLKTRNIFPLVVGELLWLYSLNVYGLL